MQTWWDNLLYMFPTLNGYFFFKTLSVTDLFILQYFYNYFMTVYILSVFIFNVIIYGPPVRNKQYQLYIIVCYIYITLSISLYTLLLNIVIQLRNAEELDKASRQCQLLDLHISSRRQMVQYHTSTSLLQRCDVVVI